MYDLDQDHHHIIAEKTVILTHGEKVLVIVNIETVLKEEVIEVPTRGKEDIKAQGQSQESLETGLVIGQVKVVSSGGGAVCLKIEERMITRAKEKSSANHQEEKAVIIHHQMR